jgi:L-asparaginase II
MTALPPIADAFAPVAVADRSGFDESVHHGAIVALDVSGEVAGSVGDPDVHIYPRSSNKPLQADAMLRLGLKLAPDELAVACASHDGTDRHVAVVRRILAGAGLGDEALDNTPDLPKDRGAAERVLMSGGGRTSIYMNCSGKHAAMVATCHANGWDTAGYLATDHPLQVAITAHVADLTGGVTHIGVDGCGAPAHVVSLRGLARAFRTLALDRGAVWAAMTSHPNLVGGERRDVTRLMTRVPDLMAKDGAEGLFAAALPDGRGVAVKIADGGARAAGVVIAAALAAIGVDIDPGELGEPMRGHGEPVGRVRPIFELVS